MIYNSLMMDIIKCECVLYLRLDVRLRDERNAAKHMVDCSEHTITLFSII